MNAVAIAIERAAEAVRSANHSARGPLDGPDAYTVVGSLAVLLDRLPQVVDFLAGSVRHTRAEHYDDRGLDPSEALAAAARALIGASDRLPDVAEHLHEAHNHLGHIGRRLTED